MRRIAQAYGVSYDAFLKHALGRTGRGARDLDDITDTELTRLSAGTGVPVERLPEMNAAAMMRRVNEQIQGWLLSESGREALEELRATLGRMARRARPTPQPTQVVSQGKTGTFMEHRQSDWLCDNATL